jgi:hypothetical protein
MKFSILNPNKPQKVKLKPSENRIFETSAEEAVKEVIVEEQKSTKKANKK